MVKQEINVFVLNSDDMPETLFWRLNSLVVSLKSFGCQWANDAFIVSKFLGAILPYQPTMVMFIQQRLDYATISPNDVLSTFVTHDNMKKTWKGLLLLLVEL